MFKSFNDFIPEIQSVITDHHLIIENIDNTIYLIKHHKFCIKIYDKAGHGYLFNYAILKKPNKDYYSKEEYVDSWFYQYIKKEFYNENYHRSIEEYNKELINFKNSFEDVVLYLKNTDDSFWLGIQELFSDQIERLKKNN